MVFNPDWRKSQKEKVEKTCNDKEFTTRVAEFGGNVAGFISYRLNDSRKIGEIELIAVSAEYQNLGIGTELNTFALQKFKESGMKMAFLSTGGDEGHAPARRSYEKAGYIGLPSYWYYKAL